MVCTAHQASVSKSVQNDKIVDPDGFLVYCSSDSIIVLVQNNDGSGLYCPPDIIFIILFQNNKTVDWWHGFVLLTRHLYHNPSSK